MWSVSAAVTLASSRAAAQRALASQGRSAVHRGLADDAGKDKDQGNPPPPSMRGMTPIGKLEELKEGQHPYQEKEPLKRHPGGVNPATGEIGGPAGPEPTRYGDWERKGRVSDF